jgi:predicted branched-subunit amino acid permease
MLLWTQIHSRPRAAVAACGAAIAAALISFTPPGVPIVAATAAILLGWRRA